MKAASIATALLKSREAIVSAFAAGSDIGGPPVGFAFAAMAAAATAAQILAMRSVSPGSSGGAPSAASGGGGASGWTDDGGSGGLPGGATVPGPSKVVNLSLVGRYYDREALRDLLEGLNDLIRDGARLNVSYG